QQSLASAEQHAKEADAKAEGFRLDIAKANERAASANETAEKERLARLQLEARLADRVITPDQQRRITAAFKGQQIEVSIFGDTHEIATFSGAIVVSIAKAEDIGMTIRRPIGGSAAVHGVLVGVRPGADSVISDVAALFVRILQETVGTGVGMWNFDELKPPSSMAAVQQVGRPINKNETAALRIFIGSK
ncbi:MAG TPA: hypothetical protein VK686_04440, partial [Bryobacteraceae bacterium]|nr:hypothetical protein [Bryobacteraceae bacterium]